MYDLIKENWNKIIERVRLDRGLSSLSFETWLKPLFIKAVDHNIVLIGCPFQKEMIDYIADGYAGPIKEAIQSELGVTCEVVFTSENEEIKKKQAYSPMAARLNDKYTFDTFVVGSNNKLAHAAAMAVAEKPGETFNPLFLYGGVGLGKTHLMHSIAHYIIEQNPNTKFLYVTSEEFTNEVIEAIRNGGNSAMSKFREKYRKIDVLLVDDVQFIIGKESTQEEFFHTFNALHSAGKQIIISSDRPPKDMDILEDRIRSRFEMGLMADIQRPDFETRVAILRKKMETDGLFIESNVIEYIASNVKSNIRELEGSLNKVVALANLENRAVDIDLAETALRDIISPVEKKAVTPDYILEVVAEHFDISLEEIKGSSRARKLSYPRQIAMYLIYNITNSNYVDIAKLLGGKNHTSVLHGYKKIQEDYQTKEETRQSIDIIKKKLNQP